MKLRWKEEEEEGGPERNGLIILNNDTLILHSYLYITYTCHSYCKDNLLHRRYCPLVD